MTLSAEKKYINRKEIFCIIRVLRFFEFSSSLLSEYGCKSLRWYFCVRKLMVNSKNVELNWCKKISVCGYIILFCT